MSAILERNGETSHYSMFDITRITPNRAFLAGSLLFELGESVRLQLSFGDDVDVGLEARVVGAAHDPVPGVEVEFTDLNEDDRTVINDWITKGQQA